MAPDAPAGGPKINVLIAIAGLGIGGAEVVVQRLAQKLDRNRFNLLIACLKVRGPIGDELAAEGTRIVVLSEAGDKKVNYLSFLGLMRLIRRERIDVVHSHTTDSLVESALCRLLVPRVKLVHTFHFGNYPHRPSRELWMERICSRAADRLVAVGEVQRQQLKAVFGFRDKAIERIWNGVTFASGEGGAAFRAALPGKPRIVIGTLATLIPQKGLFDFLAVAKRLEDLRHDVHFVIVGEGVLRPQLEAKRRELGIDDMVTLSGWVKNAAEVALPAFDIFFQPSLWEAMSIALLEGMAAGKAVATTRVGENPHIIEDGVNGLLVDAKDVDGMATALRRLIGDDELRARLGSAAAKDARQKGSVGQMTQAYEQLYTRLCRPRQRV